jgi:HEAT repeat protein
MAMKKTTKATSTKAEKTANAVTTAKVVKPAMPKKPTRSANGDFDWEALRTMWIAHADQVVAKMADEHPDETFYVLVFMLDEGFNGAGIAMQSLEEMGIAADKRAGRFDNDRWSPFEWGEREQIDVDASAAENVAMYRAFQDHLKKMKREDAYAAHARHDDVITEVAKVVAERAEKRQGAFARLKMTEDFVAFAREHDVRYPLDRARRSIDPSVLARLFPKEVDEARKRDEIAQKPLPERIAFLISKLGKDGGAISSEVAHEQLAEIGAAAVPALVAKLTDAEVGWEAAMVLAKMGSPEADSAIEPLRDVLASKHTGTHLWAACALGALGQVDHLAALAMKPKMAYYAVSGLKHGRPAAYPHLATLLDRKEAALTKQIEDLIKPGSASYDPKPSDLAAIVAHAASKHAVLRVDVASALGGPHRGAWPKEEAAKVLISMLGDKTADVRRLAANSLGDLRGGARSAIPALRALAKDKVKPVARAAAYAIDEIEDEATD